MTDDAAPFDDDDPEDGFDASDSLTEQLRNVDLRLRFLLARSTGPLDTARRIASVRDDLRSIVNRIVLAVAALDAVEPSAHSRTRSLPDRVD